ncbi:hypothetical protein BV22DRAFT_1124696 [Leucogyrophana mollusca]|uniref:Uncharacterized protein n=1 Tax=Leucogyrophana mollusca TaxID=85980 RepID=A0ACB8C0J9_9AGAM|nr:hypothetical protein BV22DRAFT_1124696 [Leucogyrophana mollusca]
MSHNKSPGPSVNSHPQMFGQSVSAPATRQKNKTYATGIAAGVEDEKYQAKYKELRRKVKEIELDNDKLHFKVLQAKKSISRMKLERAVLYERLSAVPPSPDVHDHHALPPIHPGPGIPPQHAHHIGHHHHRDHSHPADMNDHGAMDYMHPNSTVRIIYGPDGRPIQALSEGPIGPGVAPSHAVSSVHMSRRGSASGHDSSRQLPPLSQMTPGQHLEPPRAHGHSHPHSPHLHPHSNGSHSRSRSHSASSRSRGHQVPGQGPPHGYHQYSPDILPPVQHGLHSPPAPSERERSRRHDVHDRGSHHGDPHTHGRHSMVAHSHSSSSHSSLLSPPGARAGSTRIHNHQRVGPGANINHPDIEYERELDRERAWAARQRELDLERDSTREYGSSASMHASPPSHSRSRQPLDRGDYQDHHTSSYRIREEQIYPREPIGPGVHGGRSSRSGTPRSGSGSGSGNGATGEAPSRPDTHAQYYDRERPRPYVPRTANQPQTPNEELDFVHEDGRTSYNRDRIGGHLPSEQQHRPPIESSRKRSRNDMEVDGDDDVDASPTGGSSGGGGEGSSRFAGGYIPEDRGSKRLHQEGASTTPSRAFNGQEEPEDEASD